MLFLRCIIKHSITLMDKSQAWNTNMNNYVFFFHWKMIQFNLFWTSGAFASIVPVGYLCSVNKSLLFHSFSFLFFSSLFFSFLFFFSFLSPYATLSFLCLLIDTIGWHPQKELNFRLNDCIPAMHLNRNFGPQICSIEVSYNLTGKCQYAFQT